jgi:hypothetical protein
MKVEYKQGEMIITHESGHVDKYQRADLEWLRVLEVRNRNESANKIAAIDSDISKINLSIGAI